MKKILAYVISIIAVAVLITGCEQVHTHEFGEWDEVKVSSCIEDGKRVRLCECGEAEEEIISATGHVEEVIAENTATCTKSGLTEGKKCSVCGVITVKQEAVEAIGHEEKTLEAVAPTCDADGLTEGVECSRCGKILVAQDSVAAIGHSYVYYVDENGEDYMLCTRDDCGATVENAAGLYDADNKLIASWDELFNNYGSKSFSDIYQNNADIQKGTKLVIDESVTGIAGYSFEKCYSLSEVYIPKTVSIIYECVFSECLGLKKIIVDESNEHFKSIDGNLYTKDGRSLIQYAIGKEDTEFTVPEGVTRIEYGALNYANSLKKINLPASITYIAGGMLFGTKQAVEVNYVGTAEQWEKVSFPRNSWSNNMLVRYDETVRFVFLGFVSASSGGGAHYVKICDDEITVDCGSEIKYNATLGVDNLEIEYSDFVYEYAAEQGKLTALEEIKNCEKWYVLEAEDETVSTEKTMIICYSNGVHYLLSIAEGKSATGAYIIIRINSAILDVPGIDPTPITTKAFVDFDEIEIFYEENKEKIGINFLCLKAASNAENGIYVVNEWMELQKYIFEYDDENEEKFVNPRLKVEFEIYSIELGTDTDPTLDIPFHSFSVEFLSNGCSRIPVDLRMEFVDCSDADCRCNRTVYVYDGNELVGEIYLSFSLNISNDWFISFLKNNMFVLH